MNSAKVTRANINWIFGLEENMMRKQPRTTLAMLKEAVMAVELELNK